MFERFTDNARRVLVIAQEEARALQQEFIKPEHLLLGLARGEGLASTALNEAGARYTVIRERLEGLVGPAPNPRPTNKVPFSPQAKKVLEFSLREALRLGHNYIGTEHILLGLLRLAEDPKGKDNTVADLIGGLSAQLRDRVIELAAAGVSVLTRLRSPALNAALDRARQLAAQGVVTTGIVVTALLEDSESQASRALRSLGVDPGSLAAALASVGLAGTSDAVPVTPVEVKVGDVSTSIEDRDISAAIEGLTPEEIKAGLRRAFVLGPEHKATGSEG